MNKSIEKDYPYDVLFVDISLPPSTDGVMASGEDLAEYARKNLPNAKIIILTMFFESFRLHNIRKTIDPEGFLIKSDLNYVLSCDICMTLSITNHVCGYLDHIYRFLLIATYGSRNF